MDQLAPFGGNSPQAPGASGLTPPPAGVDPQQILNMMLQGPSSPQKPMPQQPGMGPKGKKDGLGKEGKANSKTPSGKIQRAIDLLQGTIDGMGPQSDVSVALSGIIRNLEMQLEKVSGPTQQEITGLPSVQGMPPLNVGTPGQLPQGNVGGIQSPSTNALQNMSGMF